MGDSNLKRVHPKIRERLKDTHNVKLEVAYTTDEVNTWIERQTEESLTNKKVLIFVGTNDLKQDKTAEQVADNLQKGTKKLLAAKCDFQVSQVPPLYLEGEDDPMKYMRYTTPSLQNNMENRQSGHS